MAAILNYISSYISAYESLRDIKMVAIPMFCDTKGSNKIIIIVSTKFGLAAMLDFQAMSFDICG